MRNIAKYAVAAALATAQVAVPATAYAQGSSQYAQTTNASSMDGGSDSYRRYINRKRLKAAGIIVALSALLIATVKIIDDDDDNPTTPVSP